MRRYLCCLAHIVSRGLYFMFFFLLVSSLFFSFSIRFSQVHSRISAIFKESLRKILIRYTIQQVRKSERNRVRKIYSYLFFVRLTINDIFVCFSFLAPIESQTKENW